MTTVDAEKLVLAYNQVRSDTNRFVWYADKGFFGYISKENHHLETISREEALVYLRSQIDYETARLRCEEASLEIVRLRIERAEKVLAELEG